MSSARTLHESALRVACYRDSAFARLAERSDVLDRLLERSMRDQLAPPDLSVSDADILEHALIFARLSVALEQTNRMLRDLN